MKWKLKKKKEAIGNLKLKKIVAGMKFLLGGLNSRFEMAKESLNLKVEQQKLHNPNEKKKWPKTCKKKKWPKKLSKPVRMYHAVQHAINWNTRSSGERKKKKIFEIMAIKHLIHKIFFNKD